MSILVLHLAVLLSRFRPRDNPSPLHSTPYTLHPTPEYRYQLKNRQMHDLLQKHLHISKKYSTFATVLNKLAL